MLRLCIKPKIILNIIWVIPKNTDSFTKSEKNKINLMNAWKIITTKGEKLLENAMSHTWSIKKHGKDEKLSADHVLSSNL